MTFNGIEKKEEGRFITRYDLSYTTKAGTSKKYEIISRRKDLTSLEDLQNFGPNAVVCIMYDATGEKILVNKEFRLSVGEWIYNFPAGLIDPGETVEQAAARELREETGLHLDSIDDVIGKSYSAVGFSDESNYCVVGRASGEFGESTSAEEEIIPGWYSKDEMCELLKSSVFAARTQAWCYVWCRQ